MQVTRAPMRTVPEVTAALAITECYDRSICDPLPVGCILSDAMADVWYIVLTARCANGYQKAVCVCPGFTDDPDTLAMHGHWIWDNIPVSTRCWLGPGLRLFRETQDWRLERVPAKLTVKSW